MTLTRMSKGEISIPPFFPPPPSHLIRGQPPSYRGVLLAVRSRLGVRCSAQLATADLEAEIFLHLMESYEG